MEPEGSVSFPQELATCLNPKLYKVLIHSTFIILFSFFVCLLVLSLLPTHCRCRGLLLHLTHFVTHTTFGRTPLDVWSAHRRDLYLKTHNTHKRQTSMLPPPRVGFEPGIPTSERPQTCVLDLHISRRSHLRVDLSNDHFPSSFTTKILFAFLFLSRARHTPVPLVIVNLVNRTMKIAKLLVM